MQGCLRLPDWLSVGERRRIAKDALVQLITQSENSQSPMQFDSSAVSHEDVFVAASAKLALRLRLRGCDSSSSTTTTITPNAQSVSAALSSTGRKRSTAPMEASLIPNPAPSKKLKTADESSGQTAAKWLDNKHLQQEPWTALDSAMMNDIALHAGLFFKSVHASWSAFSDEDLQKVAGHLFVTLQSDCTLRMASAFSAEILCPRAKQLSTPASRALFQCCRIAFSAFPYAFVKDCLLDCMVLCSSNPSVLDFVSRFVKEVMDESQCALMFTSFVDKHCQVDHTGVASSTPRIFDVEGLFVALHLLISKMAWPAPEQVDAGGKTAEVAAVSKLLQVLTSVAEKHTKSVKFGTLLVAIGSRSFLVLDDAGRRMFQQCISAHSSMMKRACSKFLAPV
eukprot:ANDGO_01677.mRNA.1 hypothetical protein